MCDEECGSIFEDILVGLSFFFLIMGFIKLLIIAIEAFLALLRFVINGILWAYYKAKGLYSRIHNSISVRQLTDRIHMGTG
ncbi:hypothetical protein VIN01S_17330 [Vibrio inusitatus NBRC 102082]|uniref:Uncharacterized protein n=1 Tax=Vibrio inusitatus NBRC 102082 TaxID=1219070 RepID=A0A4Y3HUU7_9VIBR|nr:hypothetical protein VIN01S_17330 [Vibrio inusitatus NBRC 102082]